MLAPAADSLLVPVETARIGLPAASLTVPAARMGERYSWTSAAFDIGGDADDLSFETEGKLPLGITLRGAEGAVRLSGTPVESGDFSFDLVARTSRGEVARIGLRLSVLDSAVEAGDPVLAPNLEASFPPGAGAETGADPAGLEPSLAPEPQ